MAISYPAVIGQENVAPVGLNRILAHQVFGFSRNTAGAQPENLHPVSCGLPCGRKIGAGVTIMGRGIGNMEHQPFTHATAPVKRCAEF